MHLLRWSDDKDGTNEEWVSEDLFALDNDSLVPETSKCNTRKVTCKFSGAEYLAQPILGFGLG